MADFGNVTRIRAQESDREIADKATDRSLMCCIAGCPLRWSVQTDRNYCSAHAWGDPRDHDRITQRHLDALADRAIEAQRYRPPPQPPTPEQRQHTRDTLKAWLARSRDKQPSVNRAWAHTLLARFRAGEIKPTAAQLDALKRVLPHEFRDEGDEAWA